MRLNKKVLSGYIVMSVLLSQCLPTAVWAVETNRDFQLEIGEGSLNNLTTSSHIRTTASIVDINGIVTVSNGIYTITYNVNTGKGNIRFGDLEVVNDFYSSFSVTTGSQIMINSYDAGIRDAVLEEIGDNEYGRQGKRLILTNILESGYEMKVTFEMYEGESFLLTEMSISGSGNEEIEVEYLSPMSCGQVDIGKYTDERIFTTPYTNNNDFGVAPVDDFGKFPSGEVFDGLSYWVCSIFDNEDYAGLVAGAATVKNWKSFQQIGEAEDFNGPIQGLKVYNAGGTQKGVQVSSDKFFLGYYEDYRDGLEEYGRKYALGEESMNWEGEVPLGYNSWYATRFDHTLEDMKNVVDYVAANLKTYGYEYVNLDATPFTQPEKEAFASYCKEKGLKAGGYECPFIVWDSQLGETIPGTEYTYDDAMLKDESGNPITWYLGDGAIVLDATHPAGEAAIRHSIGRFIEYGYEFLKLDFIDYGMQEGMHYNSDMNGMQAFRHGMGIIRDLVEEAEETKQQKIFISESIAPLYPSAFAHARRTGCDTELGISEKGYSGLERQAFNAVASWFTNGTIWQYNDADMAMVDNYVGGSYWMNTYSQNQARTLANYVATGGGVWLLSDNLPLLDRDRMEQVIMNPMLLEIAKEGKAGRPVKMTNFLHHNEECPPITYLKDSSGDTVVVVSNWDKANDAEIEICWEDIELQPGATYDVVDITNNNHLGSYTDKVIIDFEGAFDSRMLKITQSSDLAQKNATNIVTGQKFTASSTYYNMREYTPEHMGDEKWNTRWSAGEHKNQWIAIDFEEEQWINQLILKEFKTLEKFGYNYTITDFKVQYWDGTAYQTVTTGGKVGYERVINFKPVKTSSIRILMNATFLPSLREVEAYYIPTLIPEVIMLDEGSKELYTTYSDIRKELQRMQVFKAKSESLTRVDINVYKTGTPKGLDVGIYKLDENYNLEEKLFEANILPEQFPTELTRIPIYCNLDNLVEGKYYGVVLSASDSDQPNTYGFGYTDGNMIPDSFQVLSDNGGKTWNIENNGERDLMMTFYTEGEVVLQDIVEVESLVNKKVKLKTKFEDLALPKEVEVELLGGNKEKIEVQWNEGNYNANQEGRYILEGKLIPKENMVNTNNKVAYITVIVEKDNSGGSGGSSDGSTSIYKEKEKEEILTLGLFSPSASEMAYINGYEDYTFRPNNNLTRAEVMSMLYRLLDKKISSETQVFKDEVIWASEAIRGMHSLGIVNGYEDNTIRPNQSITRAEFIVMIYRILQLREGDIVVSKFTDVNGHWAENYINEFAVRGYISGYEGGTIRPDQPITRAESVTIINKVIDKREVGQAIVYEKFSDVDVSHWAYSDIILASH